MFSNFAIFAAAGERAPSCFNKLIVRFRMYVYTNFLFPVTGHSGSGVKGRIVSATM